MHIDRRPSQRSRGPGRRWDDYQSLRRERVAMIDGLIIGFSTGAGIVAIIFLYFFGDW